MIATPEVTRTFQGTNWRLFKELITAKRDGKRRVREIMLEGVAGTGKSFTWGMIFLRLGEMYPGLRILVTRKTRESLTDSFMKEWEEEILCGAHPMLEGAARGNRHSYQFGNGTEMVCGGMDRASKLFSTSWDIWYCQEAFEFTEEEWIKCRRSMRSWAHDALPFQLLCGDTNPDAEDHWINIRFEMGKTERFTARHTDNPKHYDVRRKARTEEGESYHQNLEALKLSEENPGVVYRRLALGEWCSASGVVWETYDRDTNLIDRPELPVDAVTPQQRAQALAQILGIRWFFAAKDWGFTEPGSLSVYGVDGDKRIYHVAQIYKTGCDIPVWANWAVELYREFNLRAIVCDPSRPDAIKSFNDALGVPNDGPMRIARPANNAKASNGADMAGLDGVRTRFRKGGDGIPRLRLLRDSLRHGRDEKLVAAKKPWCGHMEIPSYVYVQRDDGRPTKEQTDPACADHFCDELRYACAFIDDGHDLSLPTPAVKFPPTSYGAQLGHDKLLRRFRP